LENNVQNFKIKAKCNGLITNQVNGDNMNMYDVKLKLKEGLVGEEYLKCKVIYLQETVITRTVEDIKYNVYHP
jgi:hypothetical protein